jgi:type I restriction enzyme S subunit
MAAIADFAIPLPRPEMRDTIVRRAESLLALANEVEQRVEAANAKTERLAQAVLSRAFLGDIVAFDAELGRTAAR